MAELMAMKQDLVNSWAKISPSGRQFVFMRLVVIAFPAAGIKPDRPSIDEAGVGVGERQLFFQFSRQPEVVLIEKCNPLCLGLAKGIASRLAKGRIVGREKVADPGVTVRGNDVRTGVGGAVIPDDELPVVESLGQDAVDSFPQGWRPIANIHDDADQRHKLGRAAPVYGMVQTW